MIYEVLIRSDDLLLAIDNWDLGRMIDMWQYCFDQFLNIENKRFLLAFKFGMYLKDLFSPKNISKIEKYISMENA